MALLCGFQFPAFFLFRLVELRESTNRQRQMAEEEKKAANVGAVWRISKLKGFSYLPLFFPIWQQLKRILSKITSITSFKAYLWSLFDGKLEFIMSDEYRQLKFVDFAYPSFAVGGGCNARKKLSVQANHRHKPNKFCFRTMKRRSYISAFVFAWQLSFTYILIAATLYFGKNMMLHNEITPFDYLRWGDRHGNWPINNVSGSFFWLNLVGIKRGVFSFLMR